MDPSKLTLQVSHSQNQENFVLGASAARGALNTSCGRPLFFGVPLPNSGRQNLVGTATAGGSGGITQAAPCTGFPMFVPNAVHKNGVPRAAPSAFVSRGAEQLAGPSTQPSSNLPTGYSQVPINILVLHKRPEGSYSRPQLPLSQSFLLPPAMPGGPQDGAFVQRYPSHFLPLQRASNMISSNMASTPLGPAAPDKHKPVNAPVCSHQNGLEAEASTAGSETEACKLLQSAAAVVDNSCSKPETLTTPGKAEGEQHQRPQEPARLVGEGSTEDSLQNYQSMQKKAKTQINQSDGPAFSVPTVPKECTITQLELHFSGTEQIQAFKIEKGTPGRKLKPRTKKHRPKVIREDRAAKARKPAVAAPKVKPLNQTVKRSYIRKKRSLSSLENTSGPVDDKSIPNGTGTAAEGSLGSVRRRLQPEHKEQAVGAEQTSMHHHQEKLPHPQGLEYPKLTVQIGQGLQLGMENSPGGLVFGLSRKLNEMLDEYIHLPEAAPEAPSAASGCFSKAVLMDNLRELAMKHGNISSTDHPHTTRQSMLHIEERTASMKQSKRDLENSSNVDGLQLYCSSQSLSEIESAWSQMSKAWQMEKRSHEHRNNGQFTSSGTGGSIILRTPAEMQAFCQAGGIKKKRSTRSRRLSFVPIKDLESNTSEASHRLPQSCMEALFESTYIKFMTKKRSQKARLHSPNSVEPIMEHKNRISTGSIFPGGSNISNASEGNWTPDNRSINPDIGCEVPNRSLASQSIVPYIDSLQSVAWKMKYLNLNSEQVHRTEMHLSVAASPTIFFREAADSPNAIVPYGGRVVVPYERPLRLVKKQRPRAKVDLDGETSRVWNLLMGKAADPVDGTDAEKEKWWEQERGVYQGRANSFIARMQLVQGDRHFSPWKGSVVDSVVGVFLTQNVSDHLSSSAFMALAASFPPRSINSNNKDNDSQENEEIISMNAAQHESVLDYFDDSVRLDVDVNHEGLSMINGKNHMEPKDNSFSTNELVKGENYPFYDKAPDGSLHNHQQTGVAPKAQKIAENSSVELAASTKNQQEIQFQELALSEAPSESILTSETILQSRLSLSSETDYAPGNFVGGLGIAVSQELESNSNDGKLSAGNNAPINEFQCQGIGAAARTDAGQPGVYSRSIIHPVISNIDHPQLDVRNDPHVSSTSPNSSSGSAPLNMANDTIDKSDSFFMPLDAYATKNSGNKTMDVTLNFLETSTEPPVKLHHDKRTGFEASDLLDNELFEMAPKADEPGLRSGISSSNGTPETAAYTSELKKTRAASRKNKDNFDWDSLRRQACSNYYMKERSFERRDSIDWEAVRCADVHKISHAIRERGMNNILADRIQNFLNRMVRDHGSIDLEWLRDIPPDSAKDYLLSIRGLGLKSVECVRLLTLHHLAFPVDTNVGRICVRLGWVPIQPLPESLQLHLLELYPVLETIQKFLWPRLCKLDQKTLYELHYHMITFGKVFCTKSKPNCNACPMRSECKHFASAYASARLALPAPQEKSLANLTNRPVFQNDHISTSNSTHLLQLEGRTHARDLANSSEPIIEEPASPREEECPGNLENEIEDFYEDPDEIPTIKLNMEAFAQNLEDCIKESNKDLQTEDIAKAIVAISSEAASIPVPKLKNVNRLRTEHYVYELPDSHPLLQQLELDQREPDDPCPYLLIVRMQDEIKETNKAPKPCCDSQVEGILCNNEMCHACVSERQNQSRYVRGTILIPCRTAMRGSFPLNGTYFQVNEVFAEHNSSHNPILVPREQLWNLHRRMVYFGTSVPTIFKGLATQEIQQCFWRGFVCVRGFDMGTRAPKPLCPQLHLVASRSRGTRKTAASEQKISFSGDDKHKVFLADRKEII